MHQWIKLALLLVSVCAHNNVHATKLSHREYQRFTDGGPRGERKELEARDLGSYYL